MDIGDEDYKPRYGPEGELLMEEEGQSEEEEEDI